jgi:hypothetical protein
MKKIIKKIGQALQVVLMAPIKLPGKALNIIKYIALGLGVVETVLEDKEKKEVVEESPPVQQLPLIRKEVPDEDQ